MLWFRSFLNIESVYSRESVHYSVGVRFYKFYGRDWGEERQSCVWHQQKELVLAHCVLFSLSLCYFVYLSFDSQLSRSSVNVATCSNAADGVHSFQFHKLCVKQLFNTLLTSSMLFLFTFSQTERAIWIVRFGFGLLSSSLCGNWRR